MSQNAAYGNAEAPSQGAVESKPLKPISLTVLQEMKAKGEKIAMLTCYDASFSALLDTQHVDCILVGDSLGNVIQGQRTTIPVQMNDVVYHTKAVLRGLYTRPQSRAWVVADMPFGSYGTTEDALHNAVKLMQAGAHMVKVEGGAWLANTVRTLVQNGIPVCAHLGLTPQSIYKFGTYTVRAKEEQEAEKLIKDAKLLEKLGCFAIVIEKVPAELAEKVAKSVSVPIIGIGAGGGVDGQVLVIHDMLGMNNEFSPRFLRRYMNLYEEMTKAIGQYVADVKSSDFPNEKEQY